MSVNIKKHPGAKKIYERLFPNIDATENPSDLLGESTLARLWEHMQNHDIAIITAFRGATDEQIRDYRVAYHHTLKEKGVDRAYEVKEDFTHLVLLRDASDYVWKHERFHKTIDKISKRGLLDWNNERNTMLWRGLRSKGYGITKVDGTYIEGYDENDPNVGTPVKENSFFVVNLKDDPMFSKNLEVAGRHFCQDSVLLKPVGQKAMLVHTNRHIEGGSNMYTRRTILGNPIFQTHNMFMTQLGNSSFVFENTTSEGEYVNLMLRGEYAKDAKLIFDDGE